MNFNERFKARCQEIVPHRRDYRESVPNFSMAASIQTLALFMAVLELAQPRRLIEHGSGLSSLLFKAWERMGFGELIQFESNEVWAEVIRNYLWARTFDFRSRKLFRQDFFEPFALFLGGPKEEREQIAQMALPYAGHGIVLFDDANRAAVREIASAYSGGPGTLLDTSSMTLDEHGRYAFLWIGDSHVDTLAELWEDTQVQEAAWP